MKKFTDLSDKFSGPFEREKKKLDLLLFFNVVGESLVWVDKEMSK